MQNKIWKIREKQQLPEELIKSAGSELLAQLLVQRGINSTKKINEFVSLIEGYNITDIHIVNRNDNQYI